MGMSSAARAVGTATVRRVKRSLLPTRAALTLTPKAVDRVKFLVQDCPVPCVGLKVGVKQRGCNGMSYTLAYAEKKEKFDEMVEQRTSWRASLSSTTQTSRAHAAVENPSAWRKWDDGGM